MLLALTTAYAKLERLSSARELLNLLAQQCPDNPSVRLWHVKSLCGRLFLLQVLELQAETAQSEGDLEQAYRKLQQLTAMDPSNEGALIKLGEVAEVKVCPLLPLK